MNERPARPDSGCGSQGQGRSQRHRWLKSRYLQELLLGFLVDFFVLQISFFESGGPRGQPAHLTGVAKWGKAKWDDRLADEVIDQLKKSRELRR